MYTMNFPEEADEGTPTKPNELECSDTRMIFAIQKSDNSDMKLLYQGRYFREKARNTSKICDVPYMYIQSYLNLTKQKSRYNEPAREAVRISTISNYILLFCQFMIRSEQQH